MTYYQVLEVDPNASMEVIKEAYKALLMKNNPDLSFGYDVEENIKRINQAYKVLSEENSRLQYDISIGLYDAGKIRSYHNYSDNTSEIPDDEIEDKIKINKSDQHGLNGIITRIKKHFAGIPCEKLLKILIIGGVLILAVVIFFVSLNFFVKYKAQELKNGENQISGHESLSLPEEYQDFYKGVLEENIGSGYALYDIDSNGVSELLIYDELDFSYRAFGVSSPASELAVYTVNNGTVMLVETYSLPKQVFLVNVETEELFRYSLGTQHDYERTETEHKVKNGHPSKEMVEQILISDEVRAYSVEIASKEIEDIDAISIFFDPYSLVESSLANCYPIKFTRIG